MASKDRGEAVCMRNVLYSELTFTLRRTATRWRQTFTNITCLIYWFLEYDPKDKITHNKFGINSTAHFITAELKTRDLKQQYIINMMDEPHFIVIAKSQDKQS